MKELFCEACKNSFSSKKYRKTCCQECLKKLFCGERNGFFGKKHSKKTKEKISKSKTGIKVHTQESKEKISKATKGRRNHLSGKTYAEFYGEEKAKLISEKMSSSSLGHNVSEHTRKLISRTNLGRKHPEQSARLKGLKFNERYGEEKARRISKKISEANSGYKMSDSAKKKISEAVKERFRQGAKVNHSRRVVYEGIVFRSSWEVKVAKWLNDNKIKYEYESNNCRILLPSGSTYIIDFYLPEKKIYIEVKGWWNVSSIEKFIYVSKMIDVRIVDKRNIDAVSLCIKSLEEDVWKKYIEFKKNFK